MKRVDPLTNAPVDCQKRPIYIKRRLNYMWSKENPACIWKKEKKNIYVNDYKNPVVYQRRLTHIKKRSRYTLIQNQPTDLWKKKKKLTYVWTNAPCIVSKETYIYQK